MIETLARLDSRFSLSLVLVPTDRRYLEELGALAQRTAPGRVHFRDPVAPDEIVPAIAQYDMAVFLLPPVTFNYLAAMPNKLFEYLAAGLAVAIGPSPEMRQVLETWQCGVVASDFTSDALAQRLSLLSAEEIDTMKRRSLAASASFDSQAELTRYADLCRSVLGEQRQPTSTKSLRRSVDHASE